MKSIPITLVRSAQTLVHNLPHKTLKKDFVSNSLKATIPLVRQPISGFQIRATSNLSDSTLNRSLVSISSDVFGTHSKTQVDSYKIKHDPAVALLSGHPNIDTVTVKLPDIIARKFTDFFKQFPGIREFDPNFNFTESNLEKFSNLSAIVCHQLLKKYSPETLTLLRQFELDYKGISEQHGPHVIFKNLKIGDVTTIPKSDDPKSDPAYYKAQAPFISELFVLGFNKLMGFTRFPVSGEKGGVPVHHHIPMQEHSKSATSVSFKVPIAIHTEDVHYQNFYSHFYLFGKLGNSEALTPLLSVRSLMSLIPEKDRGWLIEGMKLPYLNRPGAGRVDGAPERLIVPILDQGWDKKVVLRFNGADYHSIQTGEHIFRNNPLPQTWYPDSSTFELANKTLIYLRTLFKDVDHLSKTVPEVLPLCIETGDLVLVGNKIGPHSRSTFTGPRYLHRLYANYNPVTFWDPTLNFNSLETRVQYLIGDVSKNFGAAQLHRLNQEFGIQPSSPISFSENRVNSLQLLGQLDAIIESLTYVGQTPFYLQAGQKNIETLASSLQQTSEILRVFKKDHLLEAVSDIRLMRTQTLVEDCIRNLQPFVLKLTKFNLKSEVDRVKSLGTAAAVSPARTSLSSVISDLQTYLPENKKKI